MNNLIKIFLFALILWSCSKSEKRLFWISESDGQNNDFLYMAESTNVQTITDSLTYFLTTKELLQAEKVIYKDFGEIYQNESFKVSVILRIGSKPGRDYKFIIRTFKIGGGIIDSYELAKWVEKDKEFCFGSINEQLMIKRNCETEEDIMQIAGDGKITLTSFQKSK